MVLRSKIGSSLMGFGFLFFALLPSTCLADISGIVVEDSSGLPIIGARVSLRARPDITPVLSQVDGTFLLPLTNELNALEVAAAVPYNHAATFNYLTNAVPSLDGSIGVEIRLERLPTASNTTYTPPTADGLCLDCHAQYYAEWSTARHAGAARNPWVLDLFSGTGTPGGSNGYVFRNTHDAGETGFCATCHAPLEDVANPGNLMLNEVSTVAGNDGVTCLACHQIADINDANINALHHLGKASYRFPSGLSQTEFYVWGPLADLDQIPMQNSYSPLFEDSKLCASCHQYRNPSTNAPGQNTYAEWLASPYAQPGPNYKTCQTCHMPQRSEDSPIGSGGPLRLASQQHSHEFIGTTITRLQENIFLRLTANQVGDELIVNAEVENQCGHAFPTGIAIRNALLLLDVRLNGQALQLRAGSTLPFWASDEVAGIQPGDYAGRPGKGFAKVLQGRVNGQGAVVRPVLFIDAESVLSDTVIPSGATDTSQYRFVIPPGTAQGTQIQINSELLYRRAWRALAITKGWTKTPSGMPIEMSVARTNSVFITSQSLASLPPREVPTLGQNSLAILLACLLLVAAFRWRSHFNTK